MNVYTQLATCFIELCQKVFAYIEKARNSDTRALLDDNAPSMLVAKFGGQSNNTDDTDTEVK